MFNISRANTPWLYLDIDRTKCVALGVPLSDVFNTLQIYLGSYYVNNFNEFGRTWQVNVQADRGSATASPTSGSSRCATAQGRWCRWARCCSPRHERAGAGDALQHVLRRRDHRQPAPGTSSGQAIALMESIADEELPRSMAFEWTELTYMQIQAGNTAMYVFALAVVFVFLVLAAQYESWSLPLAVILVVPMCLLCSVVGVSPGQAWTSTSSRRSASSCWSAWPARTRS